MIVLFERGKFREKFWSGKVFVRAIIYCETFFCKRNALALIEPVSFAIPSRSFGIGRANIKAKAGLASK